MILMLSGTSDGRKIGEKLAEFGHQLIMTAVSDYGGERLPNHDNINSMVGHLNQEEMQTLIKEKNIELLLDATHPYAVEASLNAINAAESAGVPYLRYERPDLECDNNEDVIYLKSYEEAAKWLSKNTGDIFLTIGSRRLLPFVKTLDISRITTRVLPTPEVVQLCTDLGFNPNQIVAMQGPFSEAMNTAMFSKYASKYLVTKASAKIGGFEEKVVAAKKAGMTTIVIERPDVIYPHKFSDINEAVTCVSKLINK